LTAAWATKHGYKTVEEFVAGAQKKFSLVETGIVDQPGCRLLLLNGVDDGVVPIEDCLVLFEHGSPKEGRYVILSSSRFPGEKSILTFADSTRASHIWDIPTVFLWPTSGWSRFWLRL
jgi:hypothetical protein